MVERSDRIVPERNGLNRPICYPKFGPTPVCLHGAFGRDLRLPLLRFIQIRPIIVGLGRKRCDYPAAVGGRKPKS